jgi:hypothetical protein
MLDQNSISVCGANALLKSINFKGERINGDLECALPSYVAGRYIVVAENVTNLPLKDLDFHKWRDQLIARNIPPL